MTLSTLIFGMCDMKPPHPSCWARTQWPSGKWHGHTWRINVQLLIGNTSARRWHMYAYRNGEKHDVHYRMWEAMKVPR